MSIRLMEWSILDDFLEPIGCSDAGRSGRPEIFRGWIKTPDLWVADDAPDYRMRDRYEK